MTNKEADRRNEQVKQRKMELAAYHCIFRSKHLLQIADAVNVDPATISGWIKTPEWQAAIELWEPNGENEVYASKLPKAVVKEQRNTKIGFAVFLTVTHGMDENQIAETLKTTQATVCAWQDTSHWVNRVAYWASGKRSLEVDDVDELDAVDDELRKRCENALKASMPAVLAPPITPITFEIDTSNMPDGSRRGRRVYGRDRILTRCSAVMG